MVSAVKPLFFNMAQLFVDLFSIFVHSVLLVCDPSLMLK